MALYYNVTNIENEDPSSFEGIHVHKEDSILPEGPCIIYDFSKHVLVELLDNETPEHKLWKELGLVQNKNVVHKRMLVDPHRKNCRRAIVVCKSSVIARELAKRLTQSKVMKRCICAVVIQELLSDLHLFEKQIIQYGDKGSQQQLVYITDLNKTREPASLARHLREKFSPFGTILSVFVSEGEDGYALPEGVIRFAYLSEAFAAELAYDQCAVAMERLSVTTHHNILLSQCDLKARLKEAQLQHFKESDVDSNQRNLPISSETVQASAWNSHSADDDVANSSSSSVISESPLVKLSSRLCKAKDTSPVKVLDLLQTDSAELADALNNPCNENLVDCLKVMGSESSASRMTSTVAASNSEAHDFDQQSSHSPLQSMRDKSWSSRVMGWITEIPNADDMHRFNESWDENRVSAAVGNIQNQSGELQDSPTDIVSNSESFVTCRNGDMASYNSNLSSPVSTIIVGEANGVQNSTLTSGRFISPLKSIADSNDRGEKDLVSSQISSRSKGNCPVSSSQKRKNSSLLTQKLSLKSQRLDSSQALSEVSENETTIRLAANNQHCYVVLDSMPELDELAKSYDGFAFPNTLQTLNSENLAPESNHTLPAPTDGSSHQIGAPVSDLSDVASTSNSTKSLPMRRSSRLAPHLKDQKASSICGDHVKRVLKFATTRPSNGLGQANKSLVEKTESPLRSWLKKELASSTNNRISGTQESTKSILCATANKDVLISVGCSHMTCDFCYPDSTKLLLGCHLN